MRRTRGRQVWPLVQLFNFRYMPLRYRVSVNLPCSPGCNLPSLDCVAQTFRSGMRRPLDRLPFLRHSTRRHRTGRRGSCTHKSRLIGLALASFRCCGSGT